LHGQGVLDLTRRVDALVGLVEELALAGHPRDRLKTQRSHGNKQQYDQQECAEKFSVDGGLH
jgi:hypothetical protein